MWQGCGGSHGTNEAALKLFVRWDVLNGELQGPVIADARHSDKRSPQDLESLVAGSLLIADLGFWAISCFEQIERLFRGQALIIAAQVFADTLNLIDRLPEGYFPRWRRLERSIFHHPLEGNEVRQRQKSTVDLFHYCWTTGSRERYQPGNSPAHLRPGCRSDSQCYSIPH